MNLLAVDLAVFERLTGAPLDTNGRPQIDSKGVPLNRTIPGPPVEADEWELLPSYGVRIPMMPGGRNTSGAGSVLPPINPFNDFSPHNFRHVIIFPYGYEGIDWENQWPAVVFNSTGLAPGETYLFDDPILAKEELEFSIKNRNDSVVGTGPGQILLRRHPDQYDVTITIKVQAKTKPEIHWLVECIRYIFPRRTGLIVKQADGSSVTFDMELEDIEYDDLGGKDPQVSLDQNQRFFSRVFTYRIESYVDNTVNAFGFNDISTHATIRERILELANIQKVLLSSQDVNQITASEES